MKETKARERTSERGQSIILLAFVLVGFLIIVGLAIDLGLVYVERVRLGRAVDAATLGAVPELPNEEAAFVRALMFLSDNGYDATNSEIVFNGTLVLTSTDAFATFHIVTSEYREMDGLDPIPDTARRIRVEGERRVPLHFMKFAGPWFSEVPVSSQAVAENVQNLDVVVVFDRSGSMEFDTICYGCWEVDDGEGYDYDEWDAGEEYPGGRRYPLSYPNELCSGYEPGDMYYTDPPNDPDGDKYIVIEAEHYSQSWPPYDPDTRGNKSSYWALQRNGVGSSTFNDNCNDDDKEAGCGGYMQHNPYSANYPEQVYNASEVGEAPYLRYDFQVPETGPYRLWLRGQGGSGDSGWGLGVNTSLIHWALDGTYEGSSTNFVSGSYYDGASYSNWRWRRVDQFVLQANTTYALQILAGGAGFRLDKIVLTNQLSDSAAGDILCNSSSGCALHGSTVQRKQGPPASAGRNGWACWPCNPIYGPPVEGSLYYDECRTAWDVDPTWQSMYDAMFDDQQPLRAAKEAVKMFIDPPQNIDNRLETEFDQIGLVSFSGSSSINSELECIEQERLGIKSCVSFQPVMDAVEQDLNSSGNTNTGAALRDGIEVLSRGGGHYGRTGTKKFIVLLTDGMPTAKPGINCGNPYPYDGGPNTYSDCAVYYAEQARDNGISIYTIGLGAAGEGEGEQLLNWIADVTDGTYFPASSKEDLEGIFLQILSRIYIRLVK